jgi:hypothetical protein
MYRMQRIFCATPWEMEPEQTLFHHAVGKFNETEAMAKGILFVPVIVTNFRDKRPMQGTVDDNMRQCSYVVLMLGDEWGPVERNFRWDYELATECMADPEMPMQDIAVLRKVKPGASATTAGDLPKTRAMFYTAAECTECLNTLFRAWLG